MSIFHSSHNFISAKPTTYLFVDGSNFRRYFDEITKKWFLYNVDFNFQKIKDFFSAEKAFYYDCIDDIKNDHENQKDFEYRINLQEERLNKIREVEGCHVHLGSLSGRGKKKRQKEVDVLLTVQMMEHALRGNMQKAVLISGDKDFRPLVESLVRLGLFVEVVGDKKHISKDLIHSADAHKKLNFNDYFHWTDDSSSSINSLPIIMSETPHWDANNPPKLIKSGNCQNQNIELIEYFSDKGIIYAIQFNDPEFIDDIFLWSKSPKELETYFELQYDEIHWIPF